MRSIALYNRNGQRLLTLKEAEQKGYGSPDALKQRIHRNQVKAYKMGNLWLVLATSISRPKRQRKARTTQRRKPRTRC